MDPDSFLNLLSPEFEDLDDDWCTPCSPNGNITANNNYDSCQNSNPVLMQPWIPCINPPSSSSSSSSSLSPSLALSSIVCENASQYSSVLKLSAIASALQSFSRPPSSSTTAPSVLSSSLTTASCTSSCSPSLSPVIVPVSAPAAACPSDLGFELAFLKPSKAHSPTATEEEINNHKPNQNQGQSQSVFSHPSPDEEQSYGDGDDQSYGYGGMYNSNNNDSHEEDDAQEGNEDEDEEDGIYRDLPAPPALVKIIRRPCSQVIVPAPKRLKTMGAANNNNKQFCSMSSASSGSAAIASSNSEVTQQQEKSVKKEGMSQREVHILSERQRRKSMRESFSILQSLIPKLKLKHTDRVTVLTEVITYIQSLRGTLEELERKRADIMEFLGLSEGAGAAGKEEMQQGCCNVSYVVEEDALVELEMDSNSTNNNMAQKGIKGGHAESNGKSKSNKSNGNSVTTTKANANSANSNVIVNSNENNESVALVEVTVRLCGSDAFITLNTPRRKGLWSSVLVLLQRYTIEVTNATLASTGNSSFHCIHGKVTNLPSIEGVDLQDKLEGVIVKELGRRPKTTKPRII